MTVFSIIVPTYNREKLISRAIESVLQQTFKDWELIIVDDGSTDNTEAVMEQFLQDERIRYFKKENSGAAHSRNIGAEKAKGDYFTFLDSDDTWEPEKLAVNYEKIKETSEKKCFYSGFRTIDSATNEVVREVIPTQPRNMQEELKNYNPIHAFSTVVIPREFFFEVKGFDIEYKARQDVDLYYRLSKISEFSAIPKILANIYYNSSDRISANSSNRLSGFELYLKRHGKDMNLEQRSFLAKRILAFALKNRAYLKVIKYLPLSLLSIFKKIGQKENLNLT